MSKEEKTLKSPLSAKNIINPAHCEECKAKVAGEAQKSLAREVLLSIEFIKPKIIDLLLEIGQTEKTIREILK